MLSRKVAERLLFKFQSCTVTLRPRIPRMWYRQCEAMPASIEDSHMVVQELLAELRQSEKRQEEVGVT